jgi:hypothetical protein
MMPGKPLLLPGCTADESIAAVVAANAALGQPHPLCIKSDDSDFWQLRGYDNSNSCRSGSSSECPHQNQCQQEQLDLQQQGQDDTSEDAEQQDSQAERSSQQQQQQQQQQSHEPDGSFEQQQNQQNDQQQQWMYQCGIKWALCCSADTMPRHHLHKCALLGKGREDLLQCGTAFGPVPDGLTVEDAAGTLVQGQARPGDEVYLQQYAAFDAAVRGEAAWSMDLPELLEWLQQFTHQVGASSFTPSNEARTTVGEEVKHGVRLCAVLIT